MGVKAGVKEQRMEQVGGYRLTFLSSENGDVIGVIIEGPKFPRPLYIPKTPGSKVNVKVPDNVRKFLIKEGFNI
ncbi:MAG: hypothetical protein ACP5LZ_05820 [Fervidicoccaceae archaeon]|jgi:hypothetical protein